MIKDIVANVSSCSCGQSFSEHLAQCDRVALFGDFFEEMQENTAHSILKKWIELVKECTIEKIAVLDNVLMDLEQEPTSAS